MQNVKKGLVLYLYWPLCITLLRVQTLYQQKQFHILTYIVTHNVISIFIHFKFLRVQIYTDTIQDVEFVGYGDSNQQYCFFSINLMQAVIFGASYHPQQHINPTGPTYYTYDPVHAKRVLIYWEYWENRGNNDYSKINKFFLVMGRYQYRYCKRQYRHISVSAKKLF